MAAVLSPGVLNMRLSALLALPLVLAIPASAQPGDEVTSQDRLAHEQMIVLGQLAFGTDVASLHAGQAMELVVEPLYEDEGVVHTVWKWKVVA